jgi:hypothetical protein
LLFDRFEMVDSRFAKAAEFAAYDKRSSFGEVSSAKKSKTPKKQQKERRR